MPGPTPDGDLLSGRYQLVRQLGRGAMGIVWEARDVMLDRTVAVKMMDARLADDTFRQRFQNEAASLAKIRSRQIVTVFDYGQVGDDLFLVTELIPDGDLQQRLRDRGALAPALALDVALQVCEGLADAHGVGVIHRDVKPANVLLWDHPQGLRAYVCDFGIAAGDGHQLTQTGAVVGSAAFMAPERHWGHPADRSSDLYSLGCLLWATLTGVAPYMGTDYQVINAHIYAPPPRFRPDSETATAVNALLDGLLSKKPSQRWADATEVAAQLRAALAVAEAEAATTPGLRLVPTPDLDAYRDPAPGAFPLGGPAGPDPDVTALGRTTQRSDRPPGGPGVGPAAGAAGAAGAPAGPPPPSPPRRPGGGAGRGTPPPPVAPEGAVPARGRRRGVLVGAVVGVLVLVGAGATAVALASSGGSAPRVSPPPTPAPSLSSTATTSATTTVSATPQPRVVAGYRAVSFTVSPGPHGEQAQWRPRAGADWRPLSGQAVTVPTAMGDQKACAWFRYVAGQPGSSPGPTVQECGRSQRPTIDFVRTTHRCTSPAYDGYTCWYYDVVASGFRSGTSPRALVFLPDGSRFCDCVFHRIRIGSDGRGRQAGTGGKPGEWQVPSTITRVTVEIAGVRQTVEL